MAVPAEYRALGVVQLLPPLFLDLELLLLLLLPPLLCDLLWLWEPLAKTVESSSSQTLIMRQMKMMYYFVRIFFLSKLLINLINHNWPLYV